MSPVVSSQFEAYVSAKFLSDGKRGTSRLLHAAFEGKVRAIKYDLYFGLDIRRHSLLRNSYLGLEICV